MSRITIAPLSGQGYITDAVRQAILETDRLFLQTVRHPFAKFVLESGRAYTAMDDLYEQAEDFDALNGAIAKRLSEAGDCVYAVTGQVRLTQLPAIKRAAEEKAGQVCILPGIEPAAAAFPGYQRDVTCAPGNIPRTLQPELSYAIEEVDGSIVAGEVKLKLMEYFPEEWEILFADVDETGVYHMRVIPLFELDRQSAYSAATVVYVKGAGFDQLERYGYEELCRVIARLRAPGGCPWDREQTHVSLKVPLMEECYELLDAIDEQNDAHLTEELGDVLMQVVFHNQIATEQGRFTSRDVTTELVQKLIYRHPHVFGQALAATSEEVLVNWDKLKKKEKGQQTQTDVLKSVPRNLPALTRAKKIQKKAGDVGFDWDNPLDALDKVLEEAGEVREAILQGSNVAEENGDLLFAAVNVARLSGLDPELTLLATCDKFVHRFEQMENLAFAAGKQLEDMPLSQQDELWNEAKKCPKLG